MKMPEYSLKETVKFFSVNTHNMDDIEIPAGTLVFPIWNESLIPEHKLKELNGARKFRSEKYVMCIIGIKWFPVREDLIKRNN